MRIANLSGRLVLIVAGGAVDVESASNGRFSADPQAAFARWDELIEWSLLSEREGAEAYDVSALGPPVPRPSQVFAVALNYAEHADEAGLAVPDAPLIFTKFPTCLTGPEATVELATDRVDWEAELVVVIGRGARGVTPENAWAHVAAVTIGVDISARDVQAAGSPPQFSLGKSFEGFGPIGPWLVTPDELADPDDLAIGCTLNGKTMQDGRTSQMVFGVNELISRVSHVCALLPGDLIFTGTPSGIGNRREPPVYLRPGDELVTSIEGIGAMTTRFRAP